MAEEQTGGGVHGQGFLAIELDGKPLPPTPNLIRRMDVIENTFSIPALVMELVDRNNALRDSHAVVDGTIVTVSFGSSEDSITTLNFQVCAVREMDSGDGSKLLRILSIFDATRYVYDSKGLHIQGTSVDALAKICNLCGLTLDNNVKTTDNMTWVSMAQSPKRFCSEIEQHMWVSDEALPKIALTADKRMLVRDINKVLTGKPDHVLCFNTERRAGEYELHEFRPKSVSGVFNGVSNYGEKLLWASSDGKTNELKSIGVMSKDPLNVNSDTRDGIVGTRQAYARHTTDINLHKNYLPAYYNWKRQSLAYTETARALIMGETNIEIFQCVEVKSTITTAVNASHTDEKTSGNWVVIGKTRSYIGNIYAEAFLLTRNFTSVAGTTNVGGGKNIINVPVPSVANILRPFQLNENIKQALDGSSVIDFISQNHDLRLNVMLDQFQLDSDVFKFPELMAKYGEGVDYLNSLMQEFSMARFLSGMCQALNQLEKLSVNLVIDMSPTILSALASRVDSMEGLLGSFTGDINGLISSGDIPSSYLDGPQLNQRCVSNKLDDLQKSVNDALPDKCMDAFSIGSLMGPSTNLSQLLRQAEENLRNLLCSLGDGTVDGSNLTGTKDGQKLEMYLPRANA
ncbi:hypothetical protein fHeYen902_014c [Yersinia phage fHe-Yen9-02]|nr:hypothetical protein fHeYen902_014c [Yersinia phage fHe-Yen9-02]